MASDRLIFSFLANVNEQTGTPVITCAVSGLVTALLAMFLDLGRPGRDALHWSITSLYCTAVSISVVLLRYKPGYIIQDNDGETAQTKDDVDTETELNEDIIAQESDDLAESFTENVTERKKTATTAPNGMNYTNKITDTLSSYQDPKSRSVKNRVWKRMFGLGRRQDEPTEESYMAAEITLAVFILSTIGLQSCVV